MQRSRSRSPSKGVQRLQPAVLANSSIDESEQAKERRDRRSRMRQKNAEIRGPEDQLKFEKDKAERQAKRKKAKSETVTSQQSHDSMGGAASVGENEKKLDVQPPAGRDASIVTGKAFLQKANVQPPVGLGHDASTATLASPPVGLGHDASTASLASPPVGLGHDASAAARVSPPVGLGHDTSTAARVQPPEGLGREASTVTGEASLQTEQLKPHSRPIVSAQLPAETAVGSREFVQKPVAEKSENPHQPQEGFGDGSATPHGSSVGGAAHSGRAGVKAGTQPEAQAGKNGVAPGPPPAEVDLVAEPLLPLSVARKKYLQQVESSDSSVWALAGAAVSAVSGLSTRLPQLFTPSMTKAPPHVLAAETQRTTETLANTQVTPMLVAPGHLRAEKGGAPAETLANAQATPALVAAGNLPAEEGGAPAETLASTQATPTLGAPGHLPAEEGGAPAETLANTQATPALGALGHVPAEEGLAAVAPGHLPAEQGGLPAQTLANTQATPALVALGHIPAEEGLAAVAPGHPPAEQGGSPAETLANTQTTPTLVALGHIPAEEGLALVAPGHLPAEEGGSPAETLANTQVTLELVALRHTPAEEGGSPAETLLDTQDAPLEERPFLTQKGNATSSEPGESEEEQGGEEEPEEVQEEETEEETDQEEEPDVLVDEEVTGHIQEPAVNETEVAAQQAEAALDISHKDYPDVIVDPLPPQAPSTPINLPEQPQGVPKTWTNFVIAAEEEKNQHQVLGRTVAVFCKNQWQTRESRTRIQHSLTRAVGDIPVCLDDTGEALDLAAGEVKRHRAEEEASETAYAQVCDKEAELLQNALERLAEARTEYESRMTTALHQASPASEVPHYVEELSKFEKLLGDKEVLWQKLTDLKTTVTLANEDQESITGVLLDATRMPQKFVTMCQHAKDTKQGELHRGQQEVSSREKELKELDQKLQEVKAQLTKYQAGARIAVGKHSEADALAPFEEAKKKFQMASQQVLELHASSLTRKRKSYDQLSASKKQRMEATTELQQLTLSSRGLPFAKKQSIVALSEQMIETSETTDSMQEELRQDFLTCYASKDEDEVTQVLTAKDTVFVRMMNAALGK